MTETEDILVLPEQEDEETPRCLDCGKSLTLFDTGVRCRNCRADRMLDKHFARYYLRFTGFNRRARRHPAQALREMTHV